MSRVEPNAFRTSFAVHDRTLVIDLGARRRILSSAPQGGGLVRARYILNHQVDANPRAISARKDSRTWEDPARSLRRLATELGLDDRSVGLMTAVAIQHLVVLREEAAHVWIEVFMTVGVTNAVRAGEPIDLARSESSRRAPGTINIILVTNARLASSAMVGMVQVATESKAAILLSNRIRSASGRAPATGTGTDALVVAGGEGPFIRYSGTHTRVGQMVAHLVARGLTEGLRRIFVRSREPL